MTGECDGFDAECDHAMADLAQHIEEEILRLSDALNSDMDLLTKAGTVEEQTASAYEKYWVTLENDIREWIADENNLEFDQEWTVRKEHKTILDAREHAVASFNKLLKKMTKRKIPAYLVEVENLATKLQTYAELIEAVGLFNMAKSCSMIEVNSRQISVEIRALTVDHLVESFKNMNLNSEKRKIETRVLNADLVDELREMGCEILFEDRIKRQPIVRLEAKFENNPETENELPLKVGEIVVLKHKSNESWWWVRNSDGQEGHVPAAYMKEVLIEEPVKNDEKEIPAGIPAARSLSAEAEEKKEKDGAASVEVPVTVDVKHDQVVIPSAATITVVPKTESGQKSPKDSEDLNSNAVDINQKISNLRRRRNHDDEEETAPTEQHAEATHKHKGKKMFGLFGKKKTKQDKKEEEKEETASVTDEYLNFDMISVDDVLERHGLLEHKENVPLLVTDCIAYLLERGTKEEGIFRIPGNHSRIRELAGQYTTDDKPNIMDEYDPMTIAGLLKYHFMNTRRKIVSDGLLNVVREYGPKSESEHVKAVKGAFRDRSVVSQEQFETLQMAFYVFREITKNQQFTKLNSKTLGRVFALSLFQDQLSVSVANLTMERWLNHYDEFFQPSNRTI